MKQFRALQSQMNHKIIRITATALFIVYPAYANAANSDGLKGIGTVLKTFQDQLKTIIPVFAAVLLLCLAIGYAGRYIEKDTFVRWAIGVAVAGSATQIATLLFTQT
ncbi:VirB2 family type IV secretion system major pilin TrwL [Bartonella raoultii]|uniref:VirB2 family type IV secretion system major pilin TrwL n=1 Tax=Bartonella raoultii TaxID=1457020 RepID=A0ABS7I4Z0_9HYPH|nr:VirB2 family type IV secretion system major pilin TrwL [Bartonella raoultii]MBX4335894.1 VirB2 family type IV secretion system major pilin TrwL [Bartonella raoultii]